jgi:hypothetical protein
MMMLIDATVVIEYIIRLLDCVCVCVCVCVLFFVCVVSWLSKAGISVDEHCNYNIYTQLLLLS